MGEIAQSVLAAPQELGIIHSGKVRDTGRAYYDCAWRRAPYTTDRASIFDIKLGFGIPRAGEILNALNIYNRLALRREMNDIPDDLILFGSDVDHALPEELQGRHDFWKRLTINEELNMLLVEGVTRDYLTGGGYRTYKSTGQVCGHLLPPGLADGAELSNTLFTPTTKAPSGQHDVDLPVEDVRKKYPSLEPFLLKTSLVISRHARNRGIIKADQKDEVGFRKGTSTLVLGDEYGTFHTCRFWDASEYKRCWPGRLPRSLDKEQLRIWGRSVDIDKLDPGSHSDRKKALTFVPSDTFIRDMTTLHLEFFKMWTGLTLEEFQHDVMRIPRSALYH